MSTQLPPLPSLTSTLLNDPLFSNIKFTSLPLSSTGSHLSSGGSCKKSQFKNLDSKLINSSSSSLDISLESQNDNSLFTESNNSSGCNKWEGTSYFKDISLIILELESKMHHYKEQKDSKSPSFHHLSSPPNLNELYDSLKVLKSKLYQTESSLKSIFNFKSLEAVKLESLLKQQQLLFYHNQNQNQNQNRQQQQQQQNQHQSQLLLSHVNSSTTSPTSSFYKSHILSLLDDMDAEESNLSSSSSDDSDSELPPKKIHKEDDKLFSSSISKLNNSNSNIHTNNNSNLNNSNSSNVLMSPSNVKKKDDWVATEALLKLNGSSSPERNNSTSSVLLDKAHSPNSPSLLSSSSSLASHVQLPNLQHLVSSSNSHHPHFASLLNGREASSSSSATASHYHSHHHHQTSSPVNSILNIDPNNCQNAAQFSFVSDESLNFTPFNDKQRKKRGKLPCEATVILKKWLFEHNMHPYPTEDEKISLSKSTNLSFSQINNWFTNARRRILPKQNEGLAISKRDSNSNPLFSQFSIAK